LTDKVQLKCRVGPYYLSRQGRVWSWWLLARTALGQGRGSVAEDRANAADPASSAHVNTTRRYTVLIVRGRSGHIAFAPKLPEVVGRGRGRNRAYKDFKARLEEHIAALVDRGVPVPEDDIVSVKYVKVDLRALESRMNLV
jgi:predicted RNase H-like HicB family nuclease